MNDSPELWKDIAQWLWGLFILPLLHIWRSMTGKVDRLDERLDTKADNAELTRVRDTQTQIFNKLDQHSSEDRDRFDKIIGDLGKLNGKMDALLGRSHKKDG